MFPVFFNRPNADITPIRVRDQSNHVIVVHAPVNVFKAVNREVLTLPTPRKTLRPLHTRLRRQTV